MIPLAIAGDVALGLPLMVLLRLAAWFPGPSAAWATVVICRFQRHPKICGGGFDAVYLASVGACDSIVPSGQTPAKFFARA